MTPNQHVPWITSLKITVSSGIAFWVMSILHLPQGFWSVVTVAAVMQAGLSNTLLKATMRASGTLIGAVLGSLCALLIPISPLMAIAAFFICLVFSSYIAVQETIYEYAAIVLGMTVSIIVFYGIMGENVHAVAVDRTVEIMLGVAIQFVVNIVMAQMIALWLPSAVEKHLVIAPSKKRIVWDKRFIDPTLRVSFAAIFTFLLWYFLRLPEGYWATISCLVIMEESWHSTMKRSGLRFLAHVIVVVLALGFGIGMAHVSYVWRAVPILMIFAGCGYLIGKQNAYSSMGNTIAIAFAIVLLAKTNEIDSIHLIVARFYNVLIGICVAFLVLCVGRSKKNSL